MIKNNRKCMVWEEKKKENNEDWYIYLLNNISAYARNETGRTREMNEKHKNNNYFWKPNHIIEWKYGIKTKCDELKYQSAWVARIRQYMLCSSKSIASAIQIIKKKKN